MTKKEIPKELKELVSWTVGLLGQSIKEVYGESFYNQIELSRKNLSKNWSGHHDQWQKDFKILKSESVKLKKLSEEERQDFAHCNTCMLELINRCETAYRSYRLKLKENKILVKKDHSVVFVLTAHPTEARGPEFLKIFDRVSELIEESLFSRNKKEEQKILHLLHVILRVPLTRKEKPQVIDEAESIYNFALKPEFLALLVKIKQEGTNVMIRSWAGGDKDGHPGVDEKTMLQSLQLSRSQILSFFASQLTKLESELNLMKDLPRQKDLLQGYSLIKIEIQNLSKLQEKDGEKLVSFRKKLNEFDLDYENSVHSKAQILKNLLDLFWLFPALVLPLEIREDSEIVTQALEKPTEFAIGRMLSVLAKISEGNEAKWYVRGFVLSMCESTENILSGIKLVHKIFDKQRLPVVPLFETQKALLQGHIILEDLYRKKSDLVDLHNERWGGRFEVMLGYSDSSKEIGVLPSRLLIAKAMKKIDKTVTKNKLTPVFFHGSGGSVERGGGSIQEQTHWWPKSSLKIFKATIQGEMVARTFATPSIFRSKIEKISQAWSRTTKNRTSKESEKIIDQFSLGIQEKYKSAIVSPHILKAVEQSSPYLYLSQLNIGSRPSKRTSEIRVGGLRAIPWILCWTQTRVLFPTWWGVGTAWSELNPKQKKVLKKAYKESDILSSFLKSLGFTLGKVELAIWRYYLEESQLSNEEVEKIFTEFTEEFKLAIQFHKELTGQKELLWDKPWLQQSIHLRSPMIHPLNILQIQAMQDKDYYLLRKTVTGVSCGMLTTG